MSKVKPHYFSHDLHSRSDKEMLRLRMKYGMEGVGIYWCMVEMLHEEGGFLLRSECERIAFELRTHSDTVSSIVQDFQLFKFDDERFWSESALRRIEAKNEKSVKARESAFKMWEKTNAMRTHSDGNANKINENKGNLKNIKSKTNQNEENFSKNGQNKTQPFVNPKAQGENVLADRFARHNQGSSGTETPVSSGTGADNQRKD